MHTGAHFSQAYFLLFDLVFGTRATQIPDTDEALQEATHLTDITAVDVGKRDILRA